jgi:hypothetical protein
MKKITIILIAYLITIGCEKEPTTSYEVTLINPTLHQITVLPFFNGSVNANDTIFLVKSSNFVIAIGNELGIVNHAGFDSKYLSGIDSLLIIYDDSFEIVHYNIAPPIVSPKSYLSSDPRNLFNYLNYEYSFEDKSKTMRQAWYRFTFTEQDYLDAKE